MSFKIESSTTGQHIWVNNLDELLVALKSAPVNGHGDDGIDWTSLPTFGGVEPADTREIWSWDETRYLVGETRRGLTIMDRSEWDAMGDA